MWRVGTDGGVAQRLTTHPSEESRAAFAPDGKTLAYSAAYEGPTEVYTLPLEGGTPVRQTYDGGAAFVAGWTPGGEILYATRRYSGLPNTQLVRVHPATGTRSPVPLAQASDGAFGADGRTLFFTRFAFQGSYTSFVGINAPLRLTGTEYSRDIDLLLQEPEDGFVRSRHSAPADPSGSGAYDETLLSRRRRPTAHPLTISLASRPTEKHLFSAVPPTLLVPKPTHPHTTGAPD